MTAGSQFQRSTVMLVLLIAVLVIGIQVGREIDSTSVDAQESEQYWHVLDMSSWRAEGILTDKPFTGTAFVEQLPADCSLLVSPHSDSIFYYSCPMEWEPTPDYP